MFPISKIREKNRLFSHAESFKDCRLRWCAINLYPRSVVSSSDSITGSFVLPSPKPLIIKFHFKTLRHKQFSRSSRPFFSLVSSTMTLQMYSVASLAVVVSLPLVLGKPMKQIEEPDDFESDRERSCEELMFFDGLGFRVATEYGVTDVCAAAKLPGHFDCRVTSIEFEDASQLCTSVGARLCTFDEIDANAGRSLGCDGLNDDKSYCWTSDSTENSECAEDEAFATRCRHFNNGKFRTGEDDPTLGTKFCRSKAAAGSLMCCASGGTDLEALLREASEARLAEDDCSHNTCAWDCAQIQGCGWVSKHGTCEAGQNTEAREMLSGKCDHVDRNLINMSPICRKFTCGKDCSEVKGCGWSKKLNQCRPGKTTSPREMSMGACSGTGAAEGEGFRSSEDCSAASCGWDCAQLNGCGWSTPANACLYDRATRKVEYALESFEGGCSDQSLVAAGLDPCRRYTCGRTCAKADGCGWSSGRGRCASGQSTSKKELNQGDCTGLAPTTEEFCDQLNCGADCASSAPICGWSSQKDRCVPKGETSVHELNAGMCANSTSCARHTCGKDCIEQDGCGWSTKRHRCVIGGKTSEEELAIGLCYGDTTSTTATSTTTTRTETSTTTTTSTTVTSTTITTETGTTVTTKTSTTTTTTTVKCDDYNPTDAPQWTDLDQDTCVAYQNNEWCSKNEDGTWYGVGWGITGDTFETYANGGFHAGQVCCACGGGSTRFDTTTKTTTTQPCPLNVAYPLAFFEEKGLGKVYPCEEGDEQKCSMPGHYSDFAPERFYQISTAKACAEICFAAPVCHGFQHKVQHKFCEVR